MTDRGGPDAEAAAIRAVRLAAIAVALVAVGGLALLLNRALDGSDDDPPLVLGEDVAADLGPVSGTPVAAYVAEQQGRLAAIEGHRVAVVSLVSYRSAAAVDDLVARVAAAEVLARLVALPGAPPVTVAGSLGEYLDAQRAPLQAERDEIAGLIPTIEDPDDPFVAAYTEDLARLDAQLASLDPAAELVFGVVVRAGADELRRLAERPEVRVVAVGPSDRFEADRTYTGVRPEELDVAGTPETRPPPA